MLSVITDITAQLSVYLNSLVVNNLIHSTQRGSPGSTSPCTIVLEAGAVLARKGTSTINTTDNGILFYGTTTIDGILTHRNTINAMVSYIMPQPLQVYQN